ncbi:hypothetical protein L228DRAFT_244874 [Xylona heveae TC161]|uniref:BZIP domain-containing protein n=1 Tax=Xylona heveae (strain CBS 132557 / TC161) TaxID=1328760 RepID=A0A165HW89_XYLHT|nr:hypothetical protein L228DRAFT_244874 [Xylona heveae TC161]KZF24013.1 hypothetical protein L228DRAFT_244874 [Xylona heveae TC161]
MSTSSAASPAGATPAPNAACFDVVDMDRYINYDQIVYPSPSTSPSSSRSQSAADITAVAAHSNTPQIFSGPSHQYDMHKQQTGLPVGALADTIAINQATNMHFGRNSGLPTNDGFLNLDSQNEFVDFGSMPMHHGSFSAASDIDLELETPNANLGMLYYPQRPVPSNDEFVNPNLLGGQEDGPAGSEAVAPQPQSNVGRLYPGMHQQQAAIAKAQAQAQQQKAIQRQQQQRAAMGQPPVHGRPSRTPANAHDALVDEKISQLLNSMRHSSVASSEDDGATPSASSLHATISRARKEEEEMDEDERLLASEEGKKLSSKERRQLRNKVSARAFRSRRKEYIGQLEGEVAARTNESNDLRAQNAALRAENTRLTDLTRMLLSSPAFSNFLNDLSANGVAPPTQAPGSENVANGTVAPPPENLGHVNVAQQSQAPQSGPQVGMPMVPDNAMNYPMVDMTPNHAWTSDAMGWAPNQPQVFSVLELPEGPAIEELDTGILSGKGSSSPLAQLLSGESKDDFPVIERIPLPEDEADEVESVESSEQVELDASDPCFALYVDAPAPQEESPAEAVVSPSSPVINSDKPAAKFELVVAPEAEIEAADSTAAMIRFERMCSSMEAAFQRVQQVTNHL